MPADGLGLTEDDGESDAEPEADSEAEGLRDAEPEADGLALAETDSDADGLAHAQADAEEYGGGDSVVGLATVPLADLLACVRRRAKADPRETGSAAEVP